jgi:hypothetical protein
MTPIPASPQAVAIAAMMSFTISKLPGLLALPSVRKNDGFSKVRAGEKSGRTVDAESPALVGVTPGFQDNSVTFAPVP